jgi:hypothetical protein
MAGEAMHFKDGTSAAAGSPVQGVSRRSPNLDAGPAADAARREAAEAPEVQNPLFLIHEHKARHDEGLSKRLEKYAKAKQHSLYVAKWAKENGTPENGWLVRAADQFSCARFLHFRQAITGEDTDWKLHNAIFCQQSHTCWMCALRKGARSVQAVVPRLLAVLQARPNLEAYMVTLTLTNGPGLAGTFNALDGGLKSLVMQCRKARQNPSHSRAMRAVVGGVGHIETKRGKGSGEWHPHYHGVWLCDREAMENPAARYPIDTTALGKAWLEVTGGLGKWTHVDRLHSDRLRRGGVTDAEGVQSALVNDLCEVIKYAVKFEGTELARDYWEAADVLRGKTLLRSFGCLHGVKVPEDLRDEPLNWEELEYIERYFRYRLGEYQEAALPGASPARFSEFDKWNQENGHASEEADQGQRVVGIGQDVVEGPGRSASATGGGGSR